MLRILGKASSINVRKVLWACAELGLPFGAWRPVQIAQGIAQCNRAMGILEGQLGRTGAYAAGAAFSLADVVLGLSLNRWLSTPMEGPDYPALRSYAELLRLRPGCREFCLNGSA